jgi:hypothetical protein
VDIGPENRQLIDAGATRIKRSENRKEKTMKGKVKMKSILGAATLAYAPLVMAREKAGYPTEKVMAFVVDKDAASLPPVYRPEGLSTC